MPPKKSTGNGSERPDFDAAAVEQRLNIWLNVEGSGRASGIGVDPQVVRVHRVLVALEHVRSRLREDPGAPLLEFIWAFNFLRPMLVHIESIPSTVLPEDAPLRAYISDIFSVESSPETARQYIQTRDLPSQDGVPDYPQEAERGLGPLQWWQIYVQGRRLSMENVKLWNDAERKRILRASNDSQRARGRGKGRGRGGGRGAGRGRGGGRGASKSGKAAPNAGDEEDSAEEGDKADEDHVEGPDGEQETPVAAPVDDSWLDIFDPEPPEDDSHWRIRLPRRILEADNPPTEYRGLPINWRHPQTIVADYTVSQEIRDTIRNAVQAGQPVPPALLWALPAMNGLPNRPLKFDERCEGCVERDEPCWYQGDDHCCSQCSVRGLPCTGGVAPHVDGSVDEHRPDLSRRRTLLQRLGWQLYKATLRSNGLMFGFEYLDFTHNGNPKVVIPEDEGNTATANTVNSASNRQSSTLTPPTSESHVQREDEHGHDQEPMDLDSASVTNMPIATTPASAATQAPPAPMDIDGAPGMSTSHGPTASTVADGAPANRGRPRPRPVVSSTARESGPASQAPAGRGLSAAPPAWLTAFSGLNGTAPTDSPASASGKRRASAIAEGVSDAADGSNRPKKRARSTNIPESTGSAASNTRARTAARASTEISQGSPGKGKKQVVVEMPPRRHQQAPPEENVVDDEGAHRDADDGLFPDGLDVTPRAAPRTTASHSQSGEDAGPSNPSARPRPRTPPLPDSIALASADEDEDEEDELEDEEDAPAGKGKAKAAPKVRRKKLRREPLPPGSGFVIHDPPPSRRIAPASGEELHAARAAAVQADHDYYLRSMDPPPQQRPHSTSQYPLRREFENLSRSVTSGREATVRFNEAMLLRHIQMQDELRQLRMNWQDLVREWRSQDRSPAFHSAEQRLLQNVSALTDYTDTSREFAHLLPAFSQPEAGNNAQTPSLPPAPTSAALVQTPANRSGSSATVDASPVHSGSSPRAGLENAFDAHEPSNLHDMLKSLIREHLELQKSVKEGQARNDAQAEATKQMAQAALEWAKVSDGRMERALKRKEDKRAAEAAERVAQAAQMRKMASATFPGAPQSRARPSGATSAVGNTVASSEVAARHPTVSATPCPAPSMGLPVDAEAKAGKAGKAGTIRIPAGAAAAVSRSETGTSTEGQIPVANAPGPVASSAGETRPTPATAPGTENEARNLTAGPPAASIAAQPSLQPPRIALPQPRASPSPANVFPPSQTMGATPFPQPPEPSTVSPPSRSIPPVRTPSPMGPEDDARAERERVLRERAQREPEQRGRGQDEREQRGREADPPGPSVMDLDDPMAGLLAVPGAPGSVGSNDAVHGRGQDIR